MNLNFLSYKLFISYKYSKLVPNYILIDKKSLELFITHDKCLNEHKIIANNYYLCSKRCEEICLLIFIYY